MSIRKFKILNIQFNTKNPPRLPKQIGLELEVAADEPDCYIFDRLVDMIADLTGRLVSSCCIKEVK